MSRSGRFLRTAGVGAIVCFLLASALLAQSARTPLRPFPDSGLVVSVTDGDTLRVRFADGVERRVRLIGVDSPELDSRIESEALKGFLSKRFAFFRLDRHEIRLEYDATSVDAFGRVLAYVFTRNGELFNELIIREGYARAFLKYPFRGDYRERFSRVEAEARRAGRGFWQTAPPEAFSPAQAKSNRGRIARVRFVCARIVQKRGYYFLAPAGGEFEALIPRDRRRLFPRSEALISRPISVWGFLEEFGRRDSDHGVLPEPALG